MEIQNIPHSQLLLGKVKHNSYGVLNAHIPGAVTRCFENFDLRSAQATLNFSTNLPRKLRPLNSLIYDISITLESIMSRENQDLSKTKKAMGINRALLERIPASPHTLDQIMAGIIMSKGRFSSAAEKIIENFPEIMIATAHIPYPGEDGNRAFGLFFSQNPKVEIENLFLEMIARDNRGIDDELNCALSSGIENGLSKSFFCKRIFETGSMRTTDGKTIKVGDLALSDYVESSQMELRKFIEVIRTSQGLDPLVVPLLRDARLMGLKEYQSIEVLMNRAALLSPDELGRLHHTRGADIGSIKGLKIRPYEHLIGQEPFRSLEILPPLSIKTDEVGHLLKKDPHTLCFFLEGKDRSLEEALKLPFLTFKNNILESIRNLPDSESTYFEALFEKAKAMQPPRLSMWSSLKSHTEMHQHLDWLAVNYAMHFRDFLPPAESNSYIRSLLWQSGVIDAAKARGGSSLGRPIIIVDAGFKGTMPILIINVLRSILMEEGLNSALFPFLDYKINGIPIPSHTEGSGGTSPLDGLSYLQNFSLPEFDAEDNLVYKQDLFLTIHDAFLNYLSLSH